MPYDSWAEPLAGISVLLILMVVVVIAAGFVLFFWP